MIELLLIILFPIFCFIGACLGFGLGDYMHARFIKKIQKELKELKKNKC